MSTSPSNQDSIQDLQGASPVLSSPATENDHVIILLREIRDSQKAHYERYCWFTDLMLESQRKAERHSQTYNIMWWIIMGGLALAVLLWAIEQFFSKFFFF